MKKFIISLILIITIPIITFSQIDFSLGISNYSVDTKESTSVGFNFGFSYDFLYFDASSNFVSGKGEQLDFSSSSTYKTDKVNIVLINIGVNIYLVKSIWSITPLIGYGTTSAIYEDPIGWDTYYYDDKRGYANFGIMSKLYLNELGIFIGTGTIENFKLGISFKVN